MTNPSESTGQQQPEGDDLKVLRDAYDRLEKQFREINNKYANLQSLSRWKEISVDGLPVEEYDKKLIVFTQFSSTNELANIEAGLWTEEIDRDDCPYFEQNYTHWRPIELPNT